MSFTPEKLHGMLFNAAKTNNMEMVRYLLTTPTFKNVIDIHAENDSALLSACQKGHIDVVKYLLTSPELTEHADIHAMKDLGLKWAVLCEHYDLARWMLTSPDLVSRASLEHEPYFFITESAKYNIDFLSFLIEHPNAPLHHYYIQHKELVINNLITLGASSETLKFFFNLRGALAIEPTQVDISLFFNEFKMLQEDEVTYALMLWSYEYDNPFFLTHVVPLIAYFLENRQDEQAFHLMMLSNYVEKNAETMLYV